jgi:uncharacterized protein YjiS (DUF1127 family)
MPAVTSISIYGTTRALRALSIVGAKLGRRVKQIVRAIRNRRDLHELTNLDDRMLADIGLTRFDVRDAYAESLWHDPGEVLTRRANERRGGRAAQRACGTALARPRTDRPARYLV